MWGGRPFRADVSSTLQSHPNRGLVLSEISLVRFTVGDLNVRERVRGRPLYASTEATRPMSDKMA
ncbi:uncharacterized protein TRAVEDRAFT_26260 [Trametes versicolor FP-101664 SS1]|uniref:uncharacterized protein n=1 Tax=Trametes versicolor (strain FP-101664) TaxID=717944 RepID=UPI0004622282|nr:uncharacterized protein TRAVEDRAFT_26260 [Trametes versicolor FP-101664 SS1]EIW62557.1 hypothetical protein TRAVEDRAFT_26260 [Trametes versicolor FP-101664 SS1]